MDKIQGLVVRWIKMELGIKHIETKYVPFLSTAIAEFTNKFYNLEFEILLNSDIISNDGKK